MNSELKLKSLSSEELRSRTYDLVLVAHGYEARATAIAKAIPNPPAASLALGFDHNQSESFSTNDAWFKSHGFRTLADIPRDDFSTALQQILTQFLNSSKTNSENTIRKIAIDISCFDRRRLAEIVSALRDINSCNCIEVDFWYCIAEFERPTSSSGRNEIAGPVHRRFAGRFTDPGLPLALIAGLGYEIGRVMGAAEYLQASRVIALFPESPIRRYEAEVTKANKLLLDDLKPREIIRYSVDDPIRTIATLDSIVRGLQHTHNIVLLPGGPKVFVLACLLVQTLYPHTSVWRVSSGSSIRAKDVKPSAHFVGLRWNSRAAN